MTMMHGNWQLRLTITMETPPFHAYKYHIIPVFFMCVVGTDTNLLSYYNKSIDSMYTPTIHFVHLCYSEYLVQMRICQIWDAKWNR